MPRTRKEKERAQKLWEERRELLRFGYGKVAEFLVRNARQAYRQALQAWAKGDLKAAEQLLRSALEKVPDAPDPLLALGQLLLKQGRTEEALGILSNAREIDRDNPQAHYWFARALEATGRLRRAVEAYEQTLRQNPPSDLIQEVRQRLQAIQETLSQQPSPTLSDEQAKALEEALHWAKFYLEIGFPRRAREYLLQAQAIAPEHPQVQDLANRLKAALPDW